jgi:glutaredoxin
MRLRFARPIAVERAAGAPSMPGRATLLMVLAFSAALGACPSPPKPTAALLDELHQRCEVIAAKGPLDIRRSKDVGVLPERTPSGTPVTIYGASWCGACEWAEAYFTRRGIPYASKNVDEDAAARRTMEETVARAGLERVHTLPVIDVRGTVTLGFFPCVVEQVWAAP